jgi:urease accessory protein
MQDFQDDKETYLLLILSDSNLPTGSFVASAGLESTAAHALFHPPPPPSPTASAAGTSTGTDSSDILAFLRNSVDTYARSALPFSRDAHRVSTAYANGEIAELDVALAALARVDALYDASTLNRVARRASCAQGIALLTLYTKALTRPPSLFTSMTGRTMSDDHASFLDKRERDRESRAGALVAALRLRVRQSESDDAPGHLPVCWGVLTGALGLDVGELEKIFDLASPFAGANQLLYTSRRRSPPTPLSSRARRALCGGAHEYLGPLRRTAAPPARSEASAL